MKSQNQELGQVMTYLMNCVFEKAIRVFRASAWIAALAIVCGSVAAADRVGVGQADFWVAPNGSDANPGTEKQPFATLDRARDAVRELHKAKPDRDVLVLLLGGTYRVERPILFAPEDSAPEGGTVTYAACAGHKPVISGGRPITGFQPGADGVWTANVPGINGGKWHFEQLYVNGRRAVRARTPNQFYFFMNGTRAAGFDPATGKTGKLDDHMFFANPEEIKPLTALPLDSLRNVVVASYHCWNISRQPVASVDPENNAVFLAGSCGVPFFVWTQNERYYLDNYRDALDAPGEWFLDRDGALHYKPLPGEDMRSAEVVAPVTDTLVGFSGAGTDRPVANITLRGLRFAHAGYLLPPQGQTSPQAACQIPAAIMADYARNIVFEDCEVEHTGTYAFWFRDGCRHCSVRRCFLNDLGAGAIRIGQTAKAPQPAEITSHIRIDNNIIRNGGHVWPDAVGVLIGHSGDNQVTHNDIADLRYSGVSVGWRWGYGEVPSVRNEIAFNHIHHLGRDVLTDMGGIYTLGEAPGTVLRHNVIHDLQTQNGGGLHGLYNDNSSSHTLLENNLVYNVPDGFAYQLTSGKANTLRNNIFVTEKGGQFSLAFYYEKEEHLAVALERNIICGTGGRLFIGREIRNRAAFRDNLYWEPSGEPISFAGLTFAEWQEKGRDAGSVIADPKFVDPTQGDFRLKSDSPALALGFVPFDSTQAGVYGDEEWIQKAKEIRYAPWERMPPGPPITLSDDFEATSLGEPPALAHVDVENKGDSIGVTEETAAGGRRSLKITDASGLKYAFNPHFYYSPRQHRGVTTLAFDIRMEPAAKLCCEWRQYPGKPYYHTGPSIVLSDGQLIAAGCPPLSVPVGKWYHIEMSAAQGDRADGTWQLTVAVPGEEPKRFDLKTASPEVRATTWLGFVSIGPPGAVFYVDNLRLSNSSD